MCRKDAQMHPQALWSFRFLHYLLSAIRSGAEKLAHRATLKRCCTIEIDDHV